MTRSQPEPAKKQMGTDLLSTEEVTIGCNQIGNDAQTTQPCSDGLDVKVNWIQHHPSPIFCNCVVN